MTTEDKAKKPTLSAGHYRSDLQGMRAVAVLAVFAEHLFGWPAGGFVGVDVFFVISGFFITGLLIRERTATGRLSFRDFYIRRVRRILPSALLVLVATVVFSFLLFPTVRAKQTLLDALYAALFLANFRFEALGADYFQQGKPTSPIQHYWSLSIEEQFYLVWPALIVVIFAATRKLRRTGKIHVREWSLLGALGVIVIASLGWAAFLSGHDPNAAYFSTLTRVWELGVGALVAIAGPWLLRLPAAIRPWLAYAGLAGVFGSMFVIDSTVQFPTPGALLPVGATALVVASFHGADVRGMFPLTNPVARYIGDVSYTLYLWHWPVITLMASLLPRGPVYYGLVVVLTVGLTVVTYRFFENPIRTSGWLLAKPSTQHGERRLPALTPSRWALIGALAAGGILTAILGIAYLDKISAATALSGGNRGARVEAGQALGAQTDPCFGAPAMVNQACVLRNPEAPLQPGIDQFVKDAYEQPCYRGSKESERGERFIKTCTYGYTGDDAVKMAIVGDSHAAQIIAAIRPVLDANKWSLTTYLGTGCKWKLPPRSDGCPVDWIEQELLSNRYDLVITTSIRGGSLDGYREAWAPIAAAGTRIAVIADNPGVSEDSQACLTRVQIGADRTGECGTPRAEAFADADPLVAAAAQVPGTTVIDLTSFYCTADFCPSVIGDVIVYRDSRGHLTSTFARTLAPAIEEGLRRALK
ncbi:MAG: acyltransferase family protein [Actinomycetota bacterium]